MVRITSVLFAAALLASTSAVPTGPFEARALIDHVGTVHALLRGIRRQCEMRGDEVHVHVPQRRVVVLLCPHSPRHQLDGMREYLNSRNLKLLYNARSLAVPRLGPGSVNALHFGFLRTDVSSMQYFSPTRADRAEKASPPRRSALTFTLAPIELQHGGTEGGSKYCDSQRINHLLIRFLPALRAFHLARPFCMQLPTNDEVNPKVKADGKSKLSSCRSTCTPSKTQIVGGEMEYDAFGMFSALSWAEESTSHIGVTAPSGKSLLGVAARCSWSSQELPQIGKPQTCTCPENMPQ
ncbi:hypothetical protein FB451DRAFT_1179191 [Mycena latifolia]|nr:hypothetical protein FB451DRAFT_1179191 [Mycena latifolia]